MNPASLSESYRRDGLIRSFDVLNDDEAQSIKLKLQTFISENQDNRDFSNWVYSKSYLALRWVADLAFHPCILDHVAALIGDDILLWDASIPLKRPQSKGYFGWHQDATYWPFESADELLAVWLAISDVSLTNGGMRAIPGSHMQGQLPHTATGDTSSMLRRGQRIDDEIDDQNAIEISLRAGQASIHHPLTIHGSGGNPSNQWRYGIIFNYVSTHTKVKNGHVESGLLIRGRPPTNGLLLETMPDADLSDAALVAYGDTLSRSSKRYADI
tara:strand:+ start:320 stop:1132 length:813 start_codon:yes stop_codon:yes gene_type:complete